MSLRRTPAETPEPEEVPDDLLGAVIMLSGKVSKLTEQVTVAANVAKTTRRIGFALIGFFALVLVFGGIQWMRVTGAIDQNCENANESRQAQRLLWGFVIDLSEAGEETTPAETAYLEEIRDWINKDVFRERDCEDLEREYPISPPPTPPAAVS